MMRRFFDTWSYVFLLAGVPLLCIAGISASTLPRNLCRATALENDARRIKLEELVAEGCGDNPHVDVTDFTCGTGFVVEYQSKRMADGPRADSNVMGSAWIPLFPKSSLPDDTLPEPKRFVILLHSRDTLTTVQGHRLLSKKSNIEGLVRPLSRFDANSDVRESLKKDYPDTDFADCLLLEPYERRDKDDVKEYVRLATIASLAGFILGLPLFLLGFKFSFLNGKSKRVGKRIRD